MFSIEKAVHWRIIRSVALWKEDTCVWKALSCVCEVHTQQGWMIGLWQVRLGTSDLGSVLGRWDAHSGS